MGTKILLMVLGVIFQFCNVLGRHNFYEYYYSRYHKDHSTTTESIPSSTSDYISWENTKDWIPTTDDNSLQNNLYEITDDDTSLQNNKYEPTGGRHRFHHLFVSRTLLIVGSIVAFLVVIGVIVCCCPKCCRGTEYRPYPRRNNVEPAAEVVPQQPIFVPYPVQQVAAQHFFVQYPQDQSLPEYQPRIMQQQPQWPRGQHLTALYPQEHFPPEYHPHAIQTQPQCSSGHHFSNQQHPQEHFLPEYQPQIAQQQHLGQHSYNFPEAPPPYESHIKN